MDHSSCRSRRAIRLSIVSSKSKIASRCFPLEQMCHDGYFWSLSLSLLLSRPGNPLQHNELEPLDFFGVSGERRSSCYFHPVTKRLHRLLSAAIRGGLSNCVRDFFCCTRCHCAPSRGQDFAQADQIGRFSAQTFGGGGKDRLSRRQDISIYVARQNRSQGRTQTSFGVNYGILF